MNDGNKIYFKGESYGGEPEEVKYFAVEGDPSFEEGETEYELTKEEVTPLSGDSYLRVDIPMGTTIDTATVTGEEIETHIKQIRHQTEIEANIGSRIKLGAIPQEGFIAAGLRIGKTGANGVVGDSITSSGSDTKRVNLENYIYSDIPYSDKIHYFSFNAFNSTQSGAMSDENIRTVLNSGICRTYIKAPLSVSYLLDSSSRVVMKKKMCRGFSAFGNASFDILDYDCIPLENVPQLSTLPTNDGTYLNQICQYIGNSNKTSNLYKGLFYKCKYNEEDPNNPYYYWEEDSTYTGQYTLRQSSNTDLLTGSNPSTLGIIFVYQKIYTLEDTNKIYCLCTICLVNIYTSQEEELRYLGYARLAGSSTAMYPYALIEMTEAEARYAFGVTDVYNQMNYEDWEQLDGEEVLENNDEEEESEIQSAEETSSPLPQENESDDDNR